MDFVLHAGKQIVALEVKSGRPGRISGLAAFRKQYPNAITVIIGANGIPLETLFRSEPADLLLHGS